jgi:hypothetical protein
MEYTGPGGLFGGIIIKADNGEVDISADNGDLVLTAGGPSGDWSGGTNGDSLTELFSHATGGTGILIHNFNDAGINITNDGNGNIGIQCDGTGSILLGVGTGGNLTIQNLPTSAPAGSGNVWNNGGVLNIT